MELSQTKRNKKSLGPGAVGKLHQFEDEIMGWALEKRESGVPLAYCNLILLKVGELDPNFRSLSFSVQYKTIRRLCIKKCFVIRRVTHTAQVHPQENVDIALQWLAVMRPILSAPDVGKNFIINMDQTPVYLSMHPRTTLSLEGMSGTLQPIR